MNTQQNNDPLQNIDVRMRTMRTLWIGLILSVVMYYVFTLIVGQPENAAPDSTLSLALLVVAFSTVLISFVIKNKLLNRAVEQQRIHLVQQAYVVAWAICEVPALLGMLDFFVTGNRYYYLLLLIAAAAQLLHFPRREHVENASHQRTSF